MSGIIHIAGVHVQVGPLLRQRCAWCGAMLLDYDLNNLAVPEGQDPTPATWPHGDLILVDGNVATIYPHIDHDELPSAVCARLDPAVTR